MLLQIKGALCSLEEEIKTQNINIYSITEVNKCVTFHNWINNMFLEENKVPRTLFEERKVAESATYKQTYKTVWNCVCLFGHLVCLGIK